MCVLNSPSDEPLKVRLFCLIFLHLLVSHSVYHHHFVYINTRAVQNQSEFMASTVFHAPRSCSAPSVKSLDCRMYVGLKPSVNLRLKFNYDKATVKARQSGRLFIVKAGETRDGEIKKLGLSDAECEAAVVAGNAPEAPPVSPKPAAPAGTPLVPSLVSFFVSMIMCYV